MGSGSKRVGRGAHSMGSAAGEVGRGARGMGSDAEAMGSSSGRVGREVYPVPATYLPSCLEARMTYTAPRTIVSQPFRYSP
jgi:hypothetical protein